MLFLWTLDQKRRNSWPKSSYHRPEDAVRVEGMVGNPLQATSERDIAR
jgi:hypothetical protein